ncbi:type II toxin-antitoxin system PrlF family antitoxin [Alteromonas sp. ASW11-19]|uniref:Type II toxin-antitoxin system PrlF family antitoxin n=1 Tax=Alteromonas salexigens TaxID=2982530 RepID=A0ABT2VJK3_9ALTE|nr:type II toxin-antitoxin system PrlF family antitoxin [Alteromonas salexigens]MCU7553386.1 type II toxin-antitoxin system PrlF family antitoxin [Alteromonas salexigens]
MANVTLETESTLTERFQTTVPSPVRKALHLKKKDKIKYSIQADGSVLITKLAEEEVDPVLGEFLAFLEHDIKKNPSNLQPLGEDLRNSVSDLVAGVEFDLDTPLSDEDE